MQPKHNSPTNRNYIPQTQFIYVNNNTARSFNRQLRQLKDNDNAFNNVSKQWIDFFTHKKFSKQLINYMANMTKCISNNNIN